MGRYSLALVVALMLVAGCSGDSEEGVASLEEGEAAADSDNAASAGDIQTETTVDQEQVMLNFAACMRDNGVQLSDPTVDADGNVTFGRLRGAVEGEVDRDLMTAAREVCDSELQGVVIGFRDRDRTGEQDVFLEYAQCMRDNGFDMPDPDFSNTGPGSAGEGRGPFGEVDRQDPDFVSAMEVCGELLSGFGPNGDGPPGIGSG